MSGSKIVIDKVEFHITNACNLDCAGCNSLSNFSVSTGSQKWADYKQIYSAWAERVNIKHLEVIGGEPLANPDYINWIIGARDLWPDATLKLVTNALLLKRTGRKFYQVCKEYGVSLAVSLHNEQTANTVVNDVKSWLVPPFSEIPSHQTDSFEINIFEKNKQLHANLLRDLCVSYNNIKGPQWPDCSSLDDWYNLNDTIRNECVNVHNFTFEVLKPSNDTKRFLVVDANGVKVEFSNEWHFIQNITMLGQDNSFELNNSYPAQAHNICAQKHCHQFYNGKLYKCPLSHIFKDFIKQFDVKLTPEDVDLINSYAPATHDMDNSELIAFVNSLKQPIAQCKFCPADLTVKQIYADSGQKIVFKKKQ